MSRHRRMIVALIAVIATGCTGEPRASESDLSRFLLSSEDAPVGTRLDAASSGPQTLEQYAENDTQKKAALEAAGFETAHFRVFVSPDLFQRRPGGKAVLAISFALLFRQPDGAKTGMKIVRDAVMREGEKLRARPARGLGDDAFALAGTLQKDLPPGFLFAWRRGNVVLGLIAAAREGEIGEDAARALAGRMAARGG